jgi:ribosomal-protein-serine acetyltransferase
VIERSISEGVRLRRLAESDAAELYALIATNRDHLARWMPWAADETERSTLDFIRLTHRQIADNDGIRTAVIVDGQIAGVVGVHGISWTHATTSIGYWLAENFQGRGAMTAAVRAYTDHAFHVWSLNRMELRCSVENARSGAIAQRLGFHREGVLRQAETVGGRRHDVSVYSMLAAEWSRPGFFGDLTS